ncbi:MAG: ATP-dependent helicase HrpB [Paracoccaceae bacterium]
MTGLPVDAVLPRLADAMSSAGRAVLGAPPGAGKTTRVPGFLLEHGIGGRIVMLEPRRVAARAAAEWRARPSGEEVGGTVGYRIRGEARAGRRTRIEVVTEGILTRMIQSDPELTGVGCLIFDEFHERSLHADLGLALALDIAGALRPDLKIVVMSATLDAAPVAALMGGAPVVTSQGRAFGVETRWLARPWRRPGRDGPGFEAAFAAFLRGALAETRGGVLAFLPGEREIRRVEALLGEIAGTRVMPLYGSLPFARQRAAIRPLDGARKLVLATAVAETSLTIEDVRVVVDGGLARRSRFDPASGMARLVTERVTKAEAEQRRGRAGRVAPGVCYRFWTRGEEGGMQPFPPAEIETTDLAPLALGLAAWGAADAAGLAFLTPPPPASFRAARSLLQDLAALDAAGRITAHGRNMAAVPAHPRLAHMLLRGGGRLAAELSAIAGARDPLRRGAVRPPADIALRLEAVRDAATFETAHPLTADRGAVALIREETHRLARLAGKGKGMSAGALLSLAYPDRVALRRPGEAPRYLMSGGKGAVLDAGDPLAGQRLLVVSDLDGDRREARIRAAAPLSEAELRGLHGGRIAWAEICEWSRRERAVAARRRETFGALVLSERAWRDPPPEALGVALADGVRDLGLEALNWSQSARLLRARVEWLRSRGAAGVPDMSDNGLLDRLEDWLAPWLTGLRTAGDLKRLDPLAALEAMLGHDGRKRLDALAPAHITAPTGTRLPIDYGGDRPTVSVRLQEMFGVTEHPVAGPDRVPLLIELLSPARRPVQKTADLPGFWATSYADVRRDLRGRYPKHPWPENPATAVPTTRANRRR